MRFIVTVRRKQQQLEPMIWLVPPGHTATHIPAHTHTCMCCVFMLVEHVSVWAASVRLLLGAPANQSRCCRFSRTSKNDVMLCSEPLCVNSGWNIFTSFPTRQKRPPWQIRWPVCETTHRKTEAPLFPRSGVSQPSRPSVGPGEWRKERPPRLWSGTAAE